MPTAIEMSKTFPELLWAGSEHSLLVAMEGHTAILAGLFDTKNEPAPAPAPRLFSKQGDVGVITIRGSLVNTDHWANEYRGLTSYNEIRTALVHAAQLPDVKAILLDIHSGGGAVSGVADTGNLITSINDNVKPVYAFTDGVMASAAYWLGASAGEVHTSKTAIMGSIGVITTHTEVSKAMKEAGIGVTVMRAGEYKALANSYEPLTEPAKKQIQDQLNGAYNVFIGHVAERRGTSVQLADQNMGQGREFFGETAVNAGLADGVHTFDSVMSRINAKPLDRAAQTANNHPNFQKGQNAMSRTALTEQQIAALQAGAAVQGAQATTTTGADAGAAAAAAAAAAPAAEAAAAAAQAAASDAAATSAAAAASQVTQSQNGNEVVSFLREQLAEANNQLVDARADNKALKDKVAAMESTQGPLMKIAAQSVSTMRVALGMSAVDMSAMSAEGLVNEHKAMADEFNKAFRAGGVAATQAAETQRTSADAVANDPLRKARLAATQI